MKTKVLLLCLFAFVSIHANTAIQKQPKRIELEAITTSSTTPSKGKRSISFLEVSALFYPDTESILLTSQGSLADAKVSVVNLLTNEILYSDSYSISGDVILNLTGLLHEGEEYCLEITVGDTVLYGNFNL